MIRLLLTLLALWPAAAAAQPATRPPAPAADAACTRLARLDLSLPDAPAAVLSAAPVNAGGGEAYCRVEAQIAPAIRFELHLPDKWNGKYLQQGCGGLCGWVNMGACSDARARGYATANTDMGHQAPPFSALWARGNLAAKIDFGWRATHATAVAAKAILAAHYGRAAERSYFRGCSTGGRQGLIEAQMFSEDFDGIIAGAPVIDETGDGLLHLLWSARAGLGPDGRPVLFAADAELAGRAVMAACDKLDGVEDGVLQDPQRCPWQPKALACGAGPDCLTPRKVAAIERIYRGAHDSRGQRLFAGGMPRGSEYQWSPAFVAAPGAMPLVLDPTGMMPGFLRYLSFLEDAPATATLMGFDWDRDPARLAVAERLYNAADPDLRRFAERGGKLILYHGWDDLEVPAALTIDYYGAVERMAGGRAAARSFARMFVLPGMAHCRRGHGADAVDWLAALEDWVERGLAPDTVTAHHLVKEQSYLGLPPLAFPLAPGLSDWSRPVPAWPGVARWTGRGDWRDAASWRAEYVPSAQRRNGSPQP